MSVTSVKAASALTCLARIVSFNSDQSFLGQQEPSSEHQNGCRFFTKAFNCFFHGYQKARLVTPLEQHLDEPLLHLYLQLLQFQMTSPVEQADMP